MGAASLFIVLVQTAVEAFALCAEKLCQTKQRKTAGLLDAAAFACSAMGSKRIGPVFTTEVVEPAVIAAQPDFAQIREGCHEIEFRATFGCPSRRTTLQLKTEQLALPDFVETCIEARVSDGAARAGKVTNRNRTSSTFRVMHKLAIPP